jgi:tetratricopeptide (TPR) repeat protein
VRSITRVSFLFYTVLLLALSWPGIVLSQNKKVDSLLALYKKLPNDTEKINTTLALSKQLLKVSKNQDALNYAKEVQEKCAASLKDPNQTNSDFYKRSYATAYNVEGNVYYFSSDYKSANSCYYKALKLYQEINDFKGIANAISNIGLMASTQGNYARAYEYYMKALRIREVINDEAGLASSYNNLGICLGHQGNYSTSLEYHFKSLAMSEKRGDKFAVTTSLTNIGAIYSNQKNYKKALEYYQRCLPLLQEIGNKLGLANVYNNLGIIAENDKEFASSIGYYQKALELRQQIGDQYGVAFSFNNIGTVYAEERNYSAALQYNMKALEIRKNIQDSLGIALSLYGMSTCYLKLGQLDQALQNCRQSYDYARKMGEKQTTLNATKGLSEIYAAKKDFEKAYYYQSRFSDMKDSLTNEENVKQGVRAEMNYEFSKKEALEKADREKQAALNEAHEHRQKLILWGVSSILILVLAFAIFAYRSYLQKQKAHTEIVQQKHIIEEKQNEILSSIHYAKRIQKVLLPQDKYIEKTIARLKQ